MFIELKTTKGSIHIRPELFSDIVSTRNDKDNILEINFSYIDSEIDDFDGNTTQEEFDLFIQRLNGYFENKQSHERMCGVTKG